MLKKTFLLNALKANAHYYREFVLRAFSVVLDDTDQPWFIKHTPDAVMAYIPTEGGGSWETLDDVNPYEIPFIYHDLTGPLKKGDVINLDRDIQDTTWGTVLINARVLGYGCGDIIPFMEGPFSPIDIEKIFVLHMQDNPKDATDKDPSKLYVDNWLKVGKAVGDLDGFEMFIPSVTEHALQPYPGMEEHRAELLAQYSEKELRDPVIQARIQSEMVNRYKAYLKGDPTEGFIFKDKTISTSIKQMFLIHGPESGFSEGTEAPLVPTSLSEGMNVKYFPEMMNSLRAGAYFRGAMTALAGTDVDLLGRIFSSVRIQPEFCGTPYALPGVTVTNQHLGRWVMEGDGHRVMITDDNLKRYVGKVVSMYNPGFCKTPTAGDNDVCAVCIGDRLAQYPTSLGSATAGKQSILMSVMMASAHAKALTTVPLLDNFLE